MKRATKPTNLAAAVVIGLTTVSCGGKVGEAVRPNDITGSAALGAATCAGSKLAKPYVVDIAPALRVELETSMKRGVVVVAYDCKNLRILPKCKVHGSYDYAGVPMKEQLVEMANQDELNVNIPFSAGKLGAELKSGNSINLALVFIGQRATTLERLDHEEVTGPSCEGATHFIADAALGAFAMGQSTAGKAGASGELFGTIGASGSSSSTRKAMTTDGSLEACKTSDPDAPKPPAQCQSPILVTLQPLDGVPKPVPPPGDGKSSATASALIDPCPTGFALSKGKCTKAPDAPKACAPNSPSCKDECAKGSSESCYNYATFAAPRAERATYYKKACDGGTPDGCAWYGRALWDSNAKSAANNELIEVVRKGCTQGGAESCSALGDFLDSRESGPSANHKAGLKSWERGCALGDWVGCSSAAAYYRAFEPSDPARVTALYERACTGSTEGSCGLLAKWLADPATPNRDPEGAARAARMECKSDPGQCEDMAVLVHEELKKDAEAFKLAKAGCDQHPKYCEQLGKFQWQGVGTAKNEPVAKQTWQKTCDAQKATNPKNTWPACYLATKGMLGK